MAGDELDKTGDAAAYGELVAALELRPSVPTQHWRGYVSWFVAPTVAIGSMVLLPTSVVCLGLAVELGVLFARSRQGGRRIDLGDFKPAIGRWTRDIYKYPSVRVKELLVAEIAELLMRRGELAEASRLFRAVVTSGRHEKMVDYARLMAAACDSLRGIDTDVELGPPQRGSEIAYCIVAARGGEPERALAVKQVLPLWVRVAYGHRRLAHERRLMLLLHTTIRGDASELSAKQRASMQAAYPGEFDYVADHWPEVRQVIETLGLNTAKLARARLRR